MIFSSLHDTRPRTVPDDTGTVSLCHTDKPFALFQGSSGGSLCLFVDLAFHTHSSVETVAEPREPLGMEVQTFQDQLAARSPHSRGLREEAK